MTRFGDLYLVTRKLANKRLGSRLTRRAARLIRRAERARVAALLGCYNGELKMTPCWDMASCDSAAEAAQRGIRCGLTPVVPVERIAAMWFTPRHPVAALLWEIMAGGRESGAGTWWICSYFWISGILNLAYLGLAVIGWWRCRAQPAAGFLILFVAIRTVAMTQSQTESRVM